MCHHAARLQGLEFTIVCHHISFILRCDCAAYSMFAEQIF